MVGLRNSTLFNHTTNSSNNNTVPPVLLNQTSIKQNRTTFKMNQMTMKQKMQMMAQSLYNKATFGPCDRGCKNIHFFAMFVSITILLSFIGGVPHKIMILR